MLCCLLRTANPNPSNGSSRSNATAVHPWQFFHAYSSMNPIGKPSKVNHSGRFPPLMIMGTLCSGTAFTNWKIVDSSLGFLSITPQIEGRFSTEAATAFTCVKTAVHKMQTCSSTAHQPHACDTCCPFSARSHCARLAPMGPFAYYCIAWRRRCTSSGLTSSFMPSSPSWHRLSHPSMKI